MSTYPDRPHGWIWRGLAILLALSLLIAILPVTTSAAPSADSKKCDYYYEVRRGDTLGLISKREGIPAGQIVEKNKMKSPYTIYVGQSLCIPTKADKKASKLASKYTKAYAVFFTAGRAKNEVLVYTYNYPKTTVLVKVDNAGDPARKFYTIGRINIAARGNKKAVRLKLPSELKNARYLFICLKDTRTSYLQCVYPRSGS